MKSRILAIFLSFLLVSCAHYSPGALKNKIVRVRGDQGMCTGEQVRAPSGKNYLLTAAHCLESKPHDGSFTVITEDGKTLQRKIIAEDPRSDLLLLEGLPSTEGLTLGYPLVRGDRVYTLTHGNDMDLYETSGAYVQIAAIPIPVRPIESPEQAATCAALPKYIVADDLCVLTTYGNIVTATVIPGSSGGPVFNSKGGLVGVVTGGNSTFSLLVTLEDIKAFLNNY